jgi:hypothetical protein
MKSSALIPLVVLTAAYSAQAAESAYPAGPPVSHFQGSCDSDPDGTKFAQKACYTTFDPGHAGVGSSYHRPACEKSAPVTERQRQILAKAYSLAPDYVKAKLCRLTLLFVVRSYGGPRSSWGFWEGSDRPPGTGVFVAISEQELGAAGPRRHRGSGERDVASRVALATEKSVADAENEITGELLGFTDSGRRHVPRMARLQTADPPDAALAALAALAHELGHALLADTNADGTDPGHPRRKVSGPPRSACFEDAFVGPSWDAERFHRNMRRWVDFGEQYNNRPKNPNVVFNVERVRNAVRQGKVDAANDLIRNVYDGTEFLSVNSIFNTWEDFADTFKYKVLADTKPNQSIGIRIRDRDINVLDRLKSDIPAKKVQCLGDLGLLTAQP